MLTFAVMGLFKGEEALFRENFPNIKFIVIKCDVNKLLERWLVRNTKIMANVGMTM